MLLILFPAFLLAGVLNGMRILSFGTAFFSAIVLLLCLLFVLDQTRGFPRKF